MAVSVQFEIGHTAKLRAKKTPEGFTHDWDLYVRGSNKSDISAYVDKVVFNLHESFQRPKRVIKEPPYVIHESGYASFILNIDIYFRNRDEPKRVQYTYDLDLQQHGPPHHRSEEKKFLFENPSEEFRQKLLKGGGVPVVPAGLTGSRSANQNMLPSSFTDSSSASNNKHKSSNSNADGSSSIKKHKSRIDESKLNTFANLFGTPDSGAKNSSSIASKTTAEALKTVGGVGAGKIYSPSLTNSASSNNIVKEKSNKESKEKSSSSSGSAEKSKDKSERKEKHKSVSNSSPSKESRSESKKSTSSQSIELAKSEKRNEDKHKKDKSRDKERDRSRSEQSLNTSTNPISTKSLNINKNSGPTSTAPLATTPQLIVNVTSSTTAANTSAQRLPTSLTPGALSRSEEKTVSISTKPEKPEKPEKETKDKHSSSSSSGKKSKKEKKDKDKDRDKERDKEKRSSGETKSKDDRSHLSALQSNIINSPSGPTISNTLSAIVHSKSKKSEKDSKHDNPKIKPSYLTEKSVDKQMTTPTSTSNNGTTPTTSTEKKTAPVVNNATSSSNNSSSSANKTHKHKKKEKNKEKDKERSGGGDKEKDKSKDKHNKEKLEDRREIEKVPENFTTKSISPELKKTVTASINLIPAASLACVTSSNTIVDNPPASKKTQSKEKKSKDSKSSKDIKRRSEPTTVSATSEPKSKVSKTSTPLSTAGSNIELSDADSRQSTHDTQKSTLPAPSVAPISSETAELHSDSSYCSFPDMPVKQSEKPIAPPSIPSPEKNNSRASTVGSKENKQREKEKSFTKSTEKSSKTEKEEKKRRRNTETTTFVEPPMKQAKKEQNKATTARDSNKSPLPRSNTGSSSNITGVGGNTRTNTKTQVEALIQNADMPSALLTVSPNAASSATALASNAKTNHANSIVSNSTQQRTTPLPASPALNNDTIWPNLSELQELHRKIMTLQDNDELQQVVEMIAASGCYELTQRTFDFDLCKLDRSTVERLQEFFATSVS